MVARAIIRSMEYTNIICTIYANICVLIKMTRRCLHPNKGMFRGLSHVYEEAL